MSNLWRTKKNRMPIYIADGSGRDFYVKYNNAGYWKENYKVQQKTEYDYPKYNNYHTLYHIPAPVKYFAAGDGRDSYIINSTGMIRDSKPLASYGLNNFLRVNKSVEGHQKNKYKRNYLSESEKRHNNSLQSLEKQLVNRLYNIPMKLNKEKKMKEDEENNILPIIGKEKENDDSKFNPLEKSSNFDLDKSKNRTMNFKKFGILSLKNNFNTILNQGKMIERYEMTNNARRSNNEVDYNFYKNGRIGCRMNELRGLSNSSAEIMKDYNRLNTDENQRTNNYFSLGKKKMLKKNNLTNPNFSNYQEHFIRSYEK